MLYQNSLPNPSHKYFLLMWFWNSKDWICSNNKLVWKKNLGLIQYWEEISVKLFIGPGSQCLQGSIISQLFLLPHTEASISSRLSCHGQQLQGQRFHEKRQDFLSLDCLGVCAPSSLNWPLFLRDGIWSLGGGAGAGHIPSPNVRYGKVVPLRSHALGLNQWLPRRKLGSCQQKRKWMLIR
jgi:hypothetical protein